MHGVIRLSNMIELLPPPLAEGALGDTIGGVACSREGGQLNSPPPYRGRSALGGCCLLKRWRASECNLTPLKGILIISPLTGSVLEGEGGYYFLHLYIQDIASATDIQNIATVTDIQDGASGLNNIGLISRI